MTIFFFLFHLGRQISQKSSLLLLLLLARTRCGRTKGSGFTTACRDVRGFRRAHLRSGTACSSAGLYGYRYRDAEREDGGGGVQGWAAWRSCRDRRNSRISLGDIVGCSARGGGTMALMFWNGRG